MGTDCAPLLANLFLFYYEYNYMKNLIKQDIWAARRFNDTVRYIDDLLKLNNRFENAIDHQSFSSKKKRMSNITVYNRQWEILRNGLR